MFCLDILTCAVHNVYHVACFVKPALILSRSQTQRLADQMQTALTSVANGLLKGHALNIVARSWTKFTDMSTCVDTQSDRHVLANVFHF